MNLKRYIRLKVGHELKRYKDASDLSQVKQRLLALKSYINQTVPGGKENDSRFNLIFTNSFPRAERHGDYDGIYANIMALGNDLKQHKRYAREWARTPESDELINKVYDLARFVKSNFPVTL